MDSDDLKEEIRRRIDIAELIGRYVPLQRAGSRLRARCPFHQEKTPSFYVDPDRGFFKCFGCGAAGDLFSFVMRIEGLTFPEAAERLAERAGLEWRPGPQQAQAGSSRPDRSWRSTPAHNAAGRALAPRSRPTSHWRCPAPQPASPRRSGQTRPPLPAQRRDPACRFGPIRPREAPRCRAVRPPWLWNASSNPPLRSSLKPY